MENYAVYERQMQDHKIRIMIGYDCDTTDPRNFALATRMVCWHRHLSLGDKHNWKYAEDFELYLKQSINDGKEYLSLPLFLLNGKNITITTKRPNCATAKVGFIFAFKDDVMTFLQGTEENWKQVARDKMLHEIDEYNEYIAGEVYTVCVESVTVCSHCGQEVSTQEMATDSLYGEKGYREFALRHGYNLDEFKKGELK